MPFTTIRFLAYRRKPASTRPAGLLRNEVTEEDRVAWKVLIGAEAEGVEVWLEETIKHRVDLPSSVGTSMLPQDDTFSLMSDCTALGYAGIVVSTGGLRASCPDDYDPATSYGGTPSFMSLLRPGSCPVPPTGCCEGDAFVYERGCFYELRRPAGSTVFSISSTPWSASDPERSQ